MKQINIPVWLMPSENHQFVAYADLVPSLAKLFKNATQKTHLGVPPGRPTLKPWR